MAIAGLIVSYIIIRSVVSDGIRNSGLIGWKKFYEQEQSNDSSNQITLDQLYEKYSKNNGDDEVKSSEEIEKAVEKEAKAYVKSKMDDRSAKRGHCIPLRSFSFCLYLRRIVI